VEDLANQSMNEYEPMNINAVSALWDSTFKMCTEIQMKGVSFVTFALFQLPPCRVQKIRSTRQPVRQISFDQDDSPVQARCGRSSVSISPTDMNTECRLEFR
jgi:hypothetical protein